MPKIELTDINPIKLIEGYTAKFVHTERMTFSFLDVLEGAVSPEHAHDQEQVAMVIEGIFELIIDGVPTQFGPGTLMIIPPNVRHGGKAITNCKLLDVFTPVREDYRALSKGH